MKTMLITEEERKHILSTHINATKRQYLNEQKDDEVLKYQQALNLVWTNVKIKEDGIMGPETTKYIKLFQKQNALSETGNLDTETKEKLSRLLDDDGELQKSWNEVKDLKKEFLNGLKSYIGKLESDDTDLCDCLTRIHFELTNFYKNPYAREKGWDPKNCENFSQLDKLMEED